MFTFICLLLTLTPAVSAEGSITSPSTADTGQPSSKRDVQLVDLLLRPS